MDAANKSVFMKNVLLLIQTSRPGFTLLELLVVVAIIAAISMSIVPLYVSSLNGIQLRNARNDLLAAIRYAQEMAVRESREYRIYFDTEENTYRLAFLTGLDKEEKVFEPAQTILGDTQQLPAFLRMDRVKARRDKHTREYYIACLPNGASDKAEIRLRDVRLRGSRFDVLVAGPLGKVSLKEQR